MTFKRFVARLGDDSFRADTFGHAPVAIKNSPASKFFDVNDEALVVHGSLKRSAANSSTKKSRK